MYSLKLVNQSPSGFSQETFILYSKSKQLIQLTTLVLTCINHARTFLSVPATTLSMVAAISLALLSHFEHTRSLSPSLTIRSYLCTTVLLKAITTRTYWLLANTDTGYIHVAEASSVALVFQIIIIVLESWSKKQWLFENTKVVDEELASFVDRSLFVRLGKLLLYGY